MKSWRVSHQHASRIDTHWHSIYYSTAKKAALPLNETCTRRARRAQRRDHAAQMSDDNARAQRNAILCAHAADIAESTVK
jgi:hypothetical protein